MNNTNKDILITSGNIEDKASPMKITGMENVNQIQNSAMTKCGINFNFKS
jgi:hypothetical protein